MIARAALVLTLLGLLAGSASPWDSHVTRKSSVDLLSLIDLKQDSVVGDWTLDRGTLVIARAAPWAHVQIPYAPPDEYDVTVIAERRELLESLNIGLVRGDTRFSVIVDGWSASVSALAIVDGSSGFSNASTKRGRLLENGKPSTIVVSVRKEGVSLAVDGKKIFDWKGDYGRLTDITPSFDVPLPRAMYIGCYSCVFAVSKMHLTPVAGAGKRLR